MRASSARVSASSASRDRGSGASPVPLPLPVALPVRLAVARLVRLAARVATASAMVGRVSSSRSARIPARSSVEPLPDLRMAFTSASSATTPRCGRDGVASSAARTTSPSQRYALASAASIPAALPSAATEVRPSATASAHAPAVARYAVSAVARSARAARYAVARVVVVVVVMIGSSRLVPGRVPGDRDNASTRRAYVMP